MRRLCVLGLAVAAIFAVPRAPRADAPAGRYSIQDCEGTACVKDNRTGLVWKRAEEVGTFTAAAAKAQCAGSWRLPAIRELQSVVDETRPAAPTIDVTAFPGASVDWLWSSTPSAREVGSTWAVSFGFGNTFVYPGTNVGGVRCVR